MTPVVDIIDDGFRLIFGLFANKSVVNYVHHWCDVQLKIYYGYLVPQLSFSR
jgi:hypothetical protein